MPSLLTTPNIPGQSTKARGEELAEELGSSALAAGSVTATQLATGAVTEAKIGAKAVTAAKIAVEGVEFSNIKHAEAIPVAVEKEAVKGVRAPARKSIFIIEGKKAAEATKFALKHELATTLIGSVNVQKATAGVAGDPLLNAAGAGNFTWKSISSEEIEVIFGTEPGAKEQFVVAIVA